MVNADAAAVTVALEQVLRETEVAQGELDRLDAVAGDGDHGVTMVLGWRAVVSALAASPPATPGEALRTAAEAFAGVGGSAGPLWGTALLRAGKALGDTPEVNTSDLAAAAAAAVDGIQERGRCSEGDRTMVDAMAPAAASLRASAQRGTLLAVALREAASAAANGANATALLEARRGRAARTPDRGHGYPDAGARGCAVFWAATTRRCTAAH